MANTTYTVHVRNGYVEVKAFVAPEVAPAHQGSSEPLRTLAQVKAQARSAIAFSGWDARTKKAAREVVNLLTKADIDASRGGVF